MRTALLTALIAAVLGVVSLVTNLSHTFNGPWQDLMQRLAPRPTRDAPVVLVEASGGGAGIAQVRDAVDRLIAAGVTRIGVVANPEVGRAYRELSARADERVTVAWPVKPEPGVAGAWRRADTALPEAPVYTLAGTAGPRYRRQPLSVSTTAGPAWTLEAVLADTTPNPEAVYHVDYRGGLASLPRIALARASRGDFLDGTVAGRVALIVPEDTWSHQLLAAPVTGPGLSPGQVHAFALRTLIEERPLGTVPTWAAGVILLLVGALGAFAATLLSNRALPILAVGLLGMCLGASAAGFAFAGLLLPTAELGLAAILPAMAQFYRRERDEDAVLARLAGTATARARERDLGAGTDADPWQLIARLVSENLNLASAVFLAPGPGSQSLAVLGGVHAGENSIAEQRRDPARAPYATTEAPNRPHELERPFLTPSADAGGRQFLVRLTFAGQTFGFWAFATAADQDPEADGTLAAVPSFAERAAELLYLEQGRSSDRPTWRTLLARAGEKRLSLELEQSLTALERRMGLFEEVLARLETAVAVYDAFGRPMHVNRAMAELAQEAGFQPYAATAGDLLSDLGGLPRPRARAYHRQAVTENGAVAAPMDRDIAGKRYMLAVAPLRLSAATSRSLFRTPSAGETRTEGVLIAFSDYTSAANLFRLAEALGRFVNTRLRNDLENIQIASDLLADPRLPDARRDRARSLLHRAIARAADELDVLDAQFVRGVSVEHAHVYPLDPQMVLQQALASVEPAAADRGVSVTVDVPTLTSPALALPEELYEVLRAAIELAIDAAGPDTALSVRLSETARTTEIAIKATGYGFPPDRAQLFLERAERDEPPMATALRRGRARLRAWGGDLTIDSALGAGMSVAVTLRRAVRTSELEAEPAADPER